MKQEALSVSTFPIHRAKVTALPEVKIPVGIYGKEEPSQEVLDSELQSILKGREYSELTQSEKHQVKLKRALNLLGRWWKYHSKCSFVNRGEHFLTIYHREISHKRPDISLLSGTHLLVSELMTLVGSLDQRRRVYIGDLKLMGESVTLKD